MILNSRGSINLRKLFNIHQWSYILQNKNNKLEIRNPDSIRPWQFVLEPLFGYLELCEKLWNCVDFHTIEKAYPIYFGIILLNLYLIKQ